MDDNNINFEKGYNDYFNISKDTNNPDVESDSKADYKIVKDKTDDENRYTYKSLEEGIPIESTFDYGSKDERWLAESSVSTIDELGDLIRKLLNAAWGDDWGVFGSEFKGNIDESQLKLPQITFDEFERETSEKGPVKPKIIDNCKETDKEGNPTGDSFQVYKQWFDVLVEFNVYGRSKKEMRDMVNRFEMLLLVYMKHLKKKGVSEMIFLKFMAGSKSEKYNSDLDAHMGSLLYFVKLERTTTVRLSTLNKLELDVKENG